MKITDVDLILDTLKDLKEYTNKLDFKTSTFINQHLIKIVPLLQEESKRLNNNSATINCPKLLVLGTKDIDTEQSLIDFANIKMSELVENNFKIIDFGLYNFNNNDINVYIKYTD